MKLDLKSDLTILNIFKDDFEYIDCFVETHCKLARSVIMLNTGNQQSYEYTKSLESAYPNLTVLFKEYSDVNFSNFRNDCLLLFPNDTEYYCWVDTDELLIAENNEIDVDADVSSINRIDGSKRFSTSLNRMFRRNIAGTWVKRIHEHFSISQGCSYAVCTDLTIQHLSSEAHRPLSKKQMYFDILESELNKSIETNNRNGIIDALQHLILMSSHDFKDPELCISYFYKFKELIFNMDPTTAEISKVQKLNILLHSLISLSRLGIVPEDALIEHILEIDKSKSTVFQLLRGLLFNPANKYTVKDIYEVVYINLDDNTDTEFNNLDFINPVEISRFETKLYAN